MYIIQMADLHIGSEKNEGSEKKILDKSIDEINRLSHKGRRFYCVYAVTLLTVRKFLMKKQFAIDMKKQEI